MTTNLRAPFPYMGGKSTVSELIWKHMGDVGNYVEPFAGSAAVLLGRPNPRGTETLNDKNGFVSNFWRAVISDPDGVAKHAAWPVLENDLHARHHWLWNNRESLQEKLESDPDWYDAKIAGWWVWGMCTTFNCGAWCNTEPRRMKPATVAHWEGRGINGITADIPAWMRALCDRLQRVKVLCGDWRRAVAPSALTHRDHTGPDHVTGVFFDPPYGLEGRDALCYGIHDSGTVFGDVVAWAIENEGPGVRIIIAGYDSMGMPEGWSEVAWTGHGGHGRIAGNDNRHRERLWLSPHCVKPATLETFDDLLGL